MLFKPLVFDKLNEADIREEIISPLLHYLNYRAGTQYNIIREQSLRYPRISIGNKNTNRDPLLRGVADYICEVNGQVRWVIEAKSPNTDITLDEIEQAYTYANHPEVRAVYFCITNGKHLVIYQTNLGPNANCLISIKYENFNDSLQIIKNLVGPEALLRDHPPQTVDIREPIGPGLRSIVRITNGHIIYNRNSLNNQILNELTTAIVGGAVERDEEGYLVAFLKTTVPFQSLQRLNQKFGMDQFEVKSRDKIISVDKNNPTIFQANRRVILPAGERMLNLQNWQEIELPCNITCYIETTASGILEGSKFVGEFTAKMQYLETGVNLSMSGEFEVYVV